ncbi:hypothetical protein COO60DRAFT_1601277, partial [Scenedesmus sp. NREL 46B-D3]
VCFGVLDSSCVLLMWRLACLTLCSAWLAVLHSSTLDFGGYCLMDCAQGDLQYVMWIPQFCMSTSFAIFTRQTAGMHGLH